MTRILLIFSLSIYEIAVFIAQEIKTTFGYELNKDEITFISLHVGAVLGKKMDEHPEIKAVLVVNNYYNYYNKHSLESITQKLSGKCKIAEVTNTLDDVNPAYYDLIIDATNQVLPQANLRVIQTNTIIYSDEPATLTKNFYKRTAMILKKYNLPVTNFWLKKNAEYSTIN